MELTTTANVATSATNELVKKTGWWASRSPVTKGLIITGVIVILAGGAYLLLRKDDKEETKKNNSESDDKVNSDNQESKSETESTQSENQTTDNSESSENDEQTSEESEEANQPEPIVYDAATLPNGGEGCAAPRLNYDSNYDYVKCNGKWYVKSKQNPKTPSTNIPEWTSLKPESLSVTRINSRYPNG